jgi:hypothetical protein
MINILFLLEAIDFEPPEEDEEELHCYLNRELNGVECNLERRIPKYWRNMVIYLKSILP